MTRALDAPSDSTFGPRGDGSRGHGESPVGWEKREFGGTRHKGRRAGPTRRAILDALRRGERSAGDIAALFPVSRPAVSRHLRVLRHAGLIGERKIARSRLYSLNARPLREVEQWLDHYRVFWGARLHDLKRYVESPEGRRSGGRTGGER